MDARELLRQLPDESVDLVVTDPPYGINFHNRRGERIRGDKKPLLDWLTEVPRILKSAGAFYLFSRWDVEHIWAAAVRLKQKNRIVWVKQNHTAGDLRRGYGQKHESILYFLKDAHRLKGKRGTDVWLERTVPPRSRCHPTQKPLSVIARIILNSTDSRNVIVDPFVGSGTTAIAAQLLDRCFLCSDIERRYIAIANRRLVQATKI